MTEVENLINKFVWSLKQLPRHVWQCPAQLFSNCTNFDEAAWQTVLQTVASLTCLDTALTCISQAVACESAQLLFPLSALPFKENDRDLDTFLDALHPSCGFVLSLPNTPPPRPLPSVSQTHSSLLRIAHPDSTQTRTHARIQHANTQSCITLWSVHATRWSDGSTAAC